ncbi:MAG: patatin family protein [Anaerotardibacter sp.]
MIGVIDVGGGLRGAYGAGVFDWCLDNKVSFDCCTGVSAGSANLSSFIAGHYGRTLRFYRDYSNHPEYMGPKALMKSGSYLDLDYIYGTLSNHDGQDPLDYQAMVNSGKQFYIVTTDATSGTPAYFSMDDMWQDNYAPLKASSSIPLACKPYEIGGRAYYDGGVSDPIPLDFTFRKGCEKIVLILTRPENFYRDPKKDELSGKLLSKTYPNAGKALMQRAKTYNRQLDEAKKLREEGKVLILAPDSIEGMDTLTKDAALIQNLYDKGYQGAKQIREFLELN